jgi:NTE family protein
MGLDIGLVSSGGLAKGTYQLGALYALNEFIPPEHIKYISFASIGALNGYAYASGNLDLVKKMWQNACCGEERVNVVRLMKGKVLPAFIDKLVERSEPASSKLYCALYDHGNKKIVYRDLRSVEKETHADYLKASIAMPSVNKPVSVSGTSFYDGGVIDNIPVWPLTKHSLDYVICMYYDDSTIQFENTVFDEKVIKITFPNASAFRESLFLHNDSVDSSVSAGYDRASFILKNALSGGYEDVDSVYAAIGSMNRNLGKRKTRLSVDVIASNLNKITQKLVRKHMLQ